MIKLGVNIDHVATLRQARRAKEPDPVTAAALCEIAGAEGITVHLREDRRHIQERDVRVLRETIKTKLNLEMAVVDEIGAIALQIHPDDVCLVPERRQELTTEGGLDVAAQEGRITQFVAQFKQKGIRVNLFIDPEEKQVRAAAAVGADGVELHTGRYADAREGEQARELERLKIAGQCALGLGLELHAGHGLDYHNVRPVAAIEGMRELNIGFAIMARAIFVGLDRAVREMKEAIATATLDAGRGTRD